jgi:hypothetical protein
MTPARWDGPGRLWSLWDIMHVLKLPALGTRLMSLCETRLTVEMARLVRTVTGVQAVTRDKRNEYLEMFRKTADTCGEIGFDKGQSAAIFAQSQILDDAELELSTLVANVRQVTDCILSDIFRRQFLVVPPEYRLSIDNANFLGEAVARRFSGAIPDIKASANCLAADCNTAAVFHLMRVVEWGLRDFCGRLGFRQVVIDRKRRKFVPVEYAQWDTILGQLQDKVDTKVASIKNKRKKQQAQEFYYPALQDIRAIKEAWRNHVMHGRSEYTAPDAEAVLSHVKRLMIALSA